VRRRRERRGRPAPGRASGASRRRRCRRLLAGDTNHVDSFRLTLANFSQFARDAVYPTARRANASSLSHRVLHDQFGAQREDFGKLCVAQRATLCASIFPVQETLTLEEYWPPPIAEPLHLFDCVMPCAERTLFWFSGKRRPRR